MDSYNGLVADHEQPSLSKHHHRVLAELLIQFNLQNIFGIHLIHGHLEVPKDHVMMGFRSQDSLSSWWTKPTPINRILMSSLHGHIFMLSSTSHLIAYEFREGPLPTDVGSIDQRFFQQFAETLVTNNLESLIGLQVLEDPPHQPMLEFVIAGQGTIMINKEIARGREVRTTGWVFERTKDGVISIKGKETHAGSSNGNHQIFTDGKPLKDIQSVLCVLAKENIIDRSPC